uniref:Tectonin beta-propeller repeat-containing protein 2 n=1 Tax=Setaria digitata TaxID=48799 RepID=A0A915Q7N9_9BILA
MISGDHQENADLATNVSEYFSHVDECPALTEQVPMALASATSEAKLTCFDVGHNYIAFGSNCGALFLFNRRIRTNADDMITCVKLSSIENDLLAAGHGSGALVLLNFPTGKPGSIRRLEQILLFDGHKGHAVSCIAWAEDGKKIFSADDAGVVVVTSVDFIHNVFQTTFVSLEHSYVVHLSHICSFLALCTPKRVAVINESSFNSVLEIDQHQLNVVGIHMVVKSYGVELFILQSNGFIIVYDVSHREKKGSFSLSENITPKFLSTDFSVESRTQQWRPCLLALDSQTFVVYFYTYIVLLKYEDQATILSTFDVNTLFQSGMFEASICVDPKFSCPTVYILGPDNRVFRLSSNEVPSYLTEVHEIPREFTAKTFLTSFQKTTGLLPNVSKGIFWDGLKVAKEITSFSSLRNFPLPISHGITDSKTISRDTSSNSLCNHSDSVFQDRKSSTTVARGKSNLSRNLEQMQIQSENIINNVNRVAQKLVDTVGGFGAQIEDGFLVQPVSDADSIDIEGVLFPVEQSGILQEIMVHRTKTAPSSKRKRAEKVKDINEQYLMVSCDEDLSPVDEHTLRNIRGALTIPSQITEADSHHQDIFHNGNIELIAECSGANQKIIWTDEVSDAGDVESEKHNPVAEVVINTNELVIIIAEQMLESITNSSVAESIREENAYELLMKDALGRKSLVFEKATNSGTSRLEDEQLVKEIALMNNFGDIWSEIKLPYSSSSFSVSSQYLIICDSRKMRRPYYLPIPYSGTPRWVKLKQKADHFVINDGGTLVWKIYKNVAFAPLENSSDSGSFLTALQWSVVAGEGGGVVEVALTTSSAWYITKSGEVFVQLCLPEMGILSRCETSWPLHSITASELAVWALQVESGRLVVRTGLKYSPIGLDWVEVVPYGPARLISICLHGQSGWAIDEKRSLWFTNGVSHQTPFGWSGSWMKVYNPWDILPDINRFLTLPWVIRVSSAGVFVCIDQRCYWSSGTCVLSGHRLEHVVPGKLSVDNNFELIAGEGLKEDFDCLTLCRVNEIFLYRLEHSYFYSLPAFPASFNSNIVEISSFNGNVYVLDSSGCIYVKENITVASPFGVDWKLLDTGSCGSPVVSFTVTSVSLWVVTTAGEICLYIKNGKNEPLIGTKPVWIHVKTDNIFDKIRASFDGMCVWVFSKNGHAWIRNSITNMLPSGNSWTKITEGPGVYDLAVGSKIVWSLSATGQLHRLQSFTINNRTRNYWKPVPLFLKAIALDRKERLWGIDLNKRLVSHKIS